MKMWNCVVPRQLSHLFLILPPVPRNQLLSVAAACKVLIEFSLLRLENPDEACAVSQVRETLSRGPTHLSMSRWH